MYAAMPEVPPQPASAPDASGENREFTIDELAAETQVPSRTIRFYQSKKALPAPERRGRKAVYTEEQNTPTDGPRTYYDVRSIQGSR